MPSVIQELADEDITLDFRHVLERVEEWKTRLLSLYSDVVAWLPQFIADQSDSVEMHEELMREYGVAPVQLPILRLSEGQAEVARFVPRGLWIIGANGRVDLFSRTRQHVIVDRSDYFSAPDWEIAPALRRLDTKPLTPDTLEQSIQ